MPAAFVTIGDTCGGRLEGLVNSAGVLVVGRFEALVAADWDRAFRVNVVGSYLTIKHAIPWLRAAPPGRVVNLCVDRGQDRRRVHRAVQRQQGGGHQPHPVCRAVARARTSW